MVGTTEHVFSHLIWNIHVYEGKLLELKEEADDLKLVNEEKSSIFRFQFHIIRLLNSFIRSRPGVRLSS